MQKPDKIIISNLQPALFLLEGNARLYPLKDVAQVEDDPYRIKI